MVSPLLYLRRHLIITIFLHLNWLNLSRAFHIFSFDFNLSVQIIILTKRSLFWFLITILFFIIWLFIFTVTITHVLFLSNLSHPWASFVLLSFRLRNYITVFQLKTMYLWICLLPSRTDDSLLFNSPRLWCRSFLRNCLGIGLKVARIVKIKLVITKFLKQIVCIIEVLFVTQCLFLTLL